MLLKEHAYVIQLYQCKTMQMQLSINHANNLVWLYDQIMHTESSVFHLFPV